MRTIVFILLVAAAGAILLLPFCLLVRRFSRKHVEQQIEGSKKYATITVTANAVIVKNETNLDWKTFTVHIFTKSRPKVDECFTCCRAGQNSETVCTYLPAGKTIECPLDDFYSAMPKIRYDRSWEIGGTGVCFTVAGGDGEYEYYQDTTA